MSRKSFQEKKDRLEKTLPDVKFLPSQFGLYNLSVAGVGFWGALLLSQDWNNWVSGLFKLGLFIISFYGMLKVYSLTNNN